MRTLLIHVVLVTCLADASVFYFLILLGSTVGRGVCYFTKASQHTIRYFFFFLMGKLRLRDKSCAKLYNY